MVLTLNLKAAEYYKDIKMKKILKPSFLYLTVIFLNPGTAY